jgi:hypothetical protein
MVEEWIFIRIPYAPVVIDFSGFIYSFNRTGFYAQNAVRRTDIITFFGGGYFHVGYSTS